MDLLTIDVVTLMCSSNVKDVSNIRPKCSVIKVVELVYYLKILLRPFWHYE